LGCIDAVFKSGDYSQRLLIARTKHNANVESIMVTIYVMFVSVLGGY
jgi:hypothetical protein